MTVDSGGRTVDVVEDYRALASAGMDELVRAGSVREVSVAVADAMRIVGPNGLTRWADRVRSFIGDEGITYGGRAQGGTARGWSLDPVPVLLSAAEWDRLESGLAQRAVLLDAVLADLYGERRLVGRGLLPAETFLGHTGFLHQATSIRLPGARQLVLAAADLARDDTGAWRLLGDRAQAPSGAAYAMANRRIIARVLPTLHRRTDIARLRGFFDAVRQALQAAAPPGVDSPRVVVLSPGPLSETAYDQALTATLLGFPLVESDDLTARDGQIWLRTTGGLERVDVLLRRVDADWCDNLELRPESRLGVPGLVEAARLGACSVVNPLGAAVLENVALLPYLDAVCRALTGEELVLRSAQTWWCGDPSARSHVLANLDRLVVKATSRGVGPASRFGWELSADERAELRARIDAQPWAWAAQEPLAMSTAPVVADGGLQPRRLVLRTFGVAHGDGYRFLPGGLARVADEPDSAMVTSITGAASKDVWVLADRDSERRAPRSARRRVRQDADRLSGPHTHDTTDLETIHGVAGLGSVTPRVAEDFYWLGRYLERVEGTARLLRVAADLDEDHGLRPGTPGAMTLDVVLRALAEVTTVRPNATDDPAPGEGSQRYLNTVLFDPDVPGTVTYAARRAIRTARAMREQMSQDVWLILSRLERTLARGDPASTNAHLQSVIGDTLELTLAVAGIQHESLVRGPEWAFLDAGRRIERAQHAVRVLGQSVAVERPPVIDAQVTEAVLVAGESVIAHRRRNAAGHGPLEPFLAAVDLLLFDGGNPRSVRHALDRLGEDLAALPPQRVGVDAVLDLVGSIDVEELGGEGRAQLAELLGAVGAGLRELSEAITRRYFVHQAPQRPLPPQFDLGRPLAGGPGRPGRPRRPRMSDGSADGPGAHYPSRVYEVRHRTTYTYEQSVSDSYGRGIFAPRDTPTQRILAHDVDTTPTPHVLTEHTDFFGNRSHYLEVRTPHTTLEVVKRSVVRVQWPAVDVAQLDEWTVGSAARHLAQAADPVERTSYVLPSQLVEIGPAVAKYAAGVLMPARPLGEALVALYRGIHADFRYAKGVTTVKTTLPELLDSRAGVCQDFAHLAVGCLRSVGMPARYVSGYIETRPPPGQEKLEGSDATHAWASVLVPAANGGKWVDLDPTNEHFADSRYIVSAWGRDYRDVAPLRGVVFTEGHASKLKVAVDVIRQPG